MGRIRCFFLEPTPWVAIKLRRYAEAFDTPEHQPRGYHNAAVPYLEEPFEEDPERPGYMLNGSEAKAPAHSAAAWPKTCDSCDYTFQEEDHWQYFPERIYRRTDTGEEMTLASAPAGAMWFAWWYDDMFTPQLAHVLVVKTPGGEWIVDSMARNCGKPEDPGQKEHHCWIIEGHLPDITVSKNGKTCSAGAGSIQCREYHGFLRQGYLEE